MASSRPATSGKQIDCLFSDVAICSGESSEHLIQKGLGGRHERKDIICSTCNLYFCAEIDPGLCDFYSLLIDTLRRFMPSQHNKRQRRKRSFVGNVPLKVSAGGIVELGDVYIERNPDGSILAINAPASMDPAKLHAIAAAHGIVKPQFSLVPLTEVTPVASIGHQFTFSFSEHRAAAKTILEVIDWQSRLESVTSYSRCPQLRRARDYVRNGAFSEYIDRSAHPIYPLEEEFVDIFGENEELFSNRVLFCNDPQANRCIGFLQIAQTMPIGICLGEAIENKDFSLLYEADLINKGKSRSEKKEKLLISYQKFKDSSFFIPKKDRKYSNEYSYNKVMQSFEHQYGRAIIFVDRNDDEKITDWIRQYATDAIDRQHIAGSKLLRAIYEPMLQIRFRELELTEADWADFLNRVERTEFDPTALEATIKADGSICSQSDILLRFYRELINLMVNRYGYPRLLSR